MAVGHLLLLLTGVIVLLGAPAAGVYLMIKLNSRRPPG